MAKYKIELVLDEQDEEDLKDFVKHAESENMSEEEVDNLSVEELIKELFYAECTEHFDFYEIDWRSKVTTEKID